MMADVMPRLLIAGVDAEHALDAPDDAADRRAHDGTDRTCDAIAFIGAMDEAAWNTPLSLGRERCSHGRDDDDACEQQLRFHETYPL